MAETAFYEERKDRLSLPMFIENPQSPNLRFGHSAQFNLTIMDCSAHRSCLSCNGASSCSWCSSRCSSSCASSETCDSFDTGTTKLLIPFTAHRTQAPLTFSLTDSSSDFECMMTMFNGKFINKNISVPFTRLNTSHGQCQLSAIFTHLASLIDAEDLGQVQTNLRLYSLKRDLFVDAIGKLTLLFYKCELKAGDCGQCLYLNRQLSCMWCGDESSASCRFMNSQSKQATQCVSALTGFISSNRTGHCDKPQIASIQPQKIPIAGGTLITVSGVNLGAVLEDLISAQLNCDGLESSESIKCDLQPSKYVASKQVACKTRPSPSGVQRNCQFSLKVRSAFEPSTGIYSSVTISSSQVLEYVDPIISDIQPGTIIQSANFVWLTIRGSDLDAGRARLVHIVDSTPGNPRPIKCEIKNVTSKELKCRLGEKFRTLGKKNVRIVFDEHMSVVHHLSLRVTADPLLKSLDRRVTIVAGGTRFILRGYNFDAVQSAYTYVSYKDLWYSEPSPAKTRISNELIQFEFPALTQLKHDEFDTTGKHELQIGFLMDGFNVTMPDAYALYLPNPQALIREADVTVEIDRLVLAIDITIDSASLLSADGIFRDDLQVLFFFFNFRILKINYRKPSNNDHGVCFN